MLKKSVIRYEHQKLIIGDDGFKEKHWKAFIKLNSLHNDKYFKVLHNGIQFNQYVGIIQVENFAVEIHPKPDRNQDDSSWRNILLPMLKACGKFSTNSLGSANVSRQNFNLLEIYFDIFLNEINRLIRQGLIKKYNQSTKNVNSLKGKLEFSGHLKRNIIHKERFYTTHQVYNKDHLIHQIIYEAILIIEQFSQQTYLSSKINSILFSFPKTKRIVVSQNTFSKIKLDRKSSVYSYAIELARLIILNYSPDIASGKEKMLSLLFDMNDLWEEFITIRLANYIDKHKIDWEITSQESKPFIKGHSLRPDIIMTNKKNNRTVVIDTKWKLGELSVSISDLRQVYSYARYWNAEKVMLLYPGNNYETDFKQYLNSNDEINHKCKLGFVSVLDGNNSLSNNIGKRVFDLLELD